MAWLQLTLDSNMQTAEKLSELLQQFGAISVSLSAISEEALFGQDNSQPGSLWQQTRVNALLHEDTDLDVLLPLLQQRLGREHVRNVVLDSLADKDWVSEYQQMHEARVFADKLCICPGWLKAPEEVPHILTLEPGLAFGTGSHETTCLCLEWLVSQDMSGKVIIDYGCGSGILALSALLLGAQHAWAVDIDEQAIEATEINADKNHLQMRLTAGRPDTMQLPQTDILVANILLNPLKTLAPTFAELVLPGGMLAVSGVLANQADDCLAAFHSWFNMDAPVFNREWVLLTGIRK